MTGCQDDTLDKTSWTLSGGRTPLHIACGHEEHLEVRKSFYKGTHYI